MIPLGCVIRATRRDSGRGRCRQPAAVITTHRVTRLGLVAALLGALLVGCSDREPSAAGASPTPERTDTSIPVVETLPNPTEQAIKALTADSERVRFKGGKGDVLEGRLFGDGDVGIVLAHGYSPEGGQYDWFPVAAVLAAEGYSALTFNFTGFCPRAHGLGAVGCSGGKENATETWRDIEPAVGFLHDNGVATVFVVGSSMGGLAALNSAARSDLEVAGVVAMGVPREPPPEFPQNRNLTDEIVGAVDEPKLFMAGSTDDDIAVAAEAMFDVASEPKELAILESPAHGSDLIVRAPADISAEAMSLLIGFIETYRAS